MMEFFELVEKRRSVRRYKKRKVEEWKVEKILEAMNRAPSAGNLQAYKVFVIQDEKVKKEICKASHDQKFIKEAPIVLVFCANPTESSTYYGERGKNLYSIQDATIAATFAMLAAHDLGLATCWVGAFNELKIKRILNTNLKPVAVGDKVILVGDLIVERIDDED